MTKPRWRENENDWANERGIIEQQTRLRETIETKQKPLLKSNERKTWSVFFL